MNLIRLEQDVTNFDFFMLFGIPSLQAHRECPQLLYRCWHLLYSIVLCIGR